MKKMWVIVSSLFLSAGQASLEASSAKAPADNADATRDTDKAAAKEASSTADQWAASVKTAPPPSQEQAVPASEPPAPAATPPPAPTPERAKPAAPSVEKPGLLTPSLPPIKLNEMQGKLLSKSYDPKTMRLVVQGGFNVEFTYDSKTIISDHGKNISIDDLGYNDDVVIRYAGKELYAIEMERLTKAPRPE